MNYNERLLFYLIRVGLETERMFDFQFTEMPDWKWIMDMSSRQGVLGVVYDGINVVEKKGLVPEDFKMCIDIRLQLKFNVARMERVAAEQYRLSREFAEACAERGITTVVFKGLSIARLYPNAKHRPCGDMDCFMMGDYEKANAIADDIGVKFVSSDTKHAHLNYKGLDIENHKFFTYIRGENRIKEFERKLQSVFYDKTFSIGNSKLLMPNNQFNALFLSVHSWLHYTKSRIGIRHICDWAMLMKYHKDDINWKSFVETLNIRDRKILLFVECVSIIAHYHMGVPMPPIVDITKEKLELSEKFLCSIYPYEEPVSLLHCNIIFRKCIRLYQILKSNWKIRTFSEHSSVYLALMKVYVTLFDRNPKI